MAIKTLFDELPAVRLAVVAALLVIAAGCNSHEVAPFRMTLCPIFANDKEGEEGSSWVLRNDIRGGKTFENLPDGQYSPALAVLLLENVCGKDIEIKSPWSSSWMLHINGFVSRRSTPLLGFGWRNDRYVKLPKGTAVALAVGMLEKNLTPYLINCFVEYKNYDDAVVSNLMYMPFCLDEDGLLASSSVDRVREVRCETASYGQDPDLQTAVSLKLYSLFHAGADMLASCTHRPGTYWPVILTRNDGEGVGLNKDDRTCLVPGCWALVVTNILKDETISLRSFDSGSWKLTIKYKSGEKREISVLPVARDHLKDRMALQPGESLSVICGCKDAVYDIHKIDTVSACYINDEEGHIFMSEELVVCHEN